jgi:hypothetical protein
MVDLRRPARTITGRVLTLLVAGVMTGCAVVPGSRLDESQRLVQSLRAENARLRDQVVGLETQNRDYADRAVDDLRRLTARDRAIAQLQRGIRAFQDDRDRLAAAYRRLAVGLGRPAEDVSARPTAAPRETAAVPGSDVRAKLTDAPPTERLSAPDDEDGVRPSGRAPAAGSGP